MNTQQTTAPEQAGKPAPATTPSGRPITCDGCGAVIPREEVTEAMTSPVPDEISIRNYGKTGLIYIVCKPLPAGEPGRAGPRAGRRGRGRAGRRAGPADDPARPWKRGTGEHH